MIETANSANRQIARAAGMVMIAFLLSQVTGLVRQILVSSVFGTTITMDAYNAANSIPGLIFNLVAGGALASAFIPTFTGFITKDDQAPAWKLASAVVNLVLAIMVVFSILAAISAPAIVKYVIYALKPDLDPALQGLTINLLRILMLTPALFGVSGLLTGILNAHQKFWLPALAPTMYWLGVIFGVAALSPRLGIYGMAWGTVVGAAMHLGIQLPDLFRLAKKHYFPTFGIHNRTVREVILLMGPRLLSVGVLQINFLVNTIIAEGLSAGSLTSITVAFMVMSVPLYAIASAIGTAALPTFSAQIARGEMDEMRTSLAAALRGVLLLSLPASLGLILLREPIIAMLFQHGEFTADSTKLVAWALLWYSAGLLFHSLLEILARAFYATHDTMTPALVSVGAMGLNVGLSFSFVALFARIGWMPHGGLALANSLATSLETTILFFLIRKRLNGIHGPQIARGFGAAVAGTLVMAAGLVFWRQVMSSHSATLTALGGVVVGGALYGLVLMLIRVPEVRTVITMIRQRLLKV